MKMSWSSMLKYVVGPWGSSIAFVMKWKYEATTNVSEDICAPFAQIKDHCHHAAMGMYLHEILLLELIGLI